MITYYIFLVSSLKQSTTQQFNFISRLSGSVNNNNIYRANKFTDRNLLHDVIRLTQRTKCFIIDAQCEMNTGEKSDLINSSKLSSYYP